MKKKMISGKSGYSKKFTTTKKPSILRFPSLQNIARKKSKSGHPTKTLLSVKSLSPHSFMENYSLNISRSKTTNIDEEYSHLNLTERRNESIRNNRVNAMIQLLHVELNYKFRNIQDNDNRKIDILFQKFQNNLNIRVES